MTSQREPHFGDGEGAEPEPMHRSTVVHAQSPRRARRGGGLGASLLILILLAATGGSGYFAYTQYEERGRLETALAASRQSTRIEALEARGTADQVKKLNTQLNSTQSARRKARKKASSLTASLRKSEAKIAELEKAAGAASKALEQAKAERDRARAGKLGAERNLAEALRADSAGDAKVRALQKALKKAEGKAEERAVQLKRLGKAHEEAVAARAAAEEKAEAALKRAEESIATAKADAGKRAADTAKAIEAAEAAKAAKAAKLARAARAAREAKEAETAKAAEAVKASQAAAAPRESRRVTAEGEIRTSAPARSRRTSGFDSVLKAVEEMKLDSGN